MTFDLIFTAALLGVGLSMDAFSISLANGLTEPRMGIARTSGIAGVYAGFQFVMPMIGWYLVTRVAEKFEAFRPFIPWIALVLLLMIGGSLLKEGIDERRKKSSGEDESDSSGYANHQLSEDDVFNSTRLGFGMLVMQGAATSIDALSVGFTIASYGAMQAFCFSLIIGIVTFTICFTGLRIGRRLGTILADRAQIAGGIILIAIGLEIWAKGVLF